MAKEKTINCGDILTDGVSIANKGAKIPDKIFAMASGQKKSPSEGLRFGEPEFVPQQIGAVRGKHAPYPLHFICS